MTNQEINIAIAEACGWTNFTPNTIQYTARRADGKWDLIPDYCNDLNAMHEAEKALGNRLPVYREFLALIVTDDPTNRHNERAFATARQRAEAFLRTLGKWEEKKFDFS